MAPESKRKIIEALLELYRVPQASGFPHLSIPPNLTMASIQFSNAGAAEQFCSLMQGGFRDKTPALRSGDRFLQAQLDEDMELRQRRRAANSIRNAASDLYNKAHMAKALEARNFQGLVSTISPEYDAVTVRYKGEGDRIFIATLADRIEGHPRFTARISESTMISLGEDPKFAATLYSTSEEAFNNPPRRGAQDSN